MSGVICNMSSSCGMASSPRDETRRFIASVSRSSVSGKCRNASVRHTENAAHPITRSSDGGTRAVVIGFGVSERFENVFSTVGSPKCEQLMVVEVVAIHLTRRA